MPRKGPAPRRPVVADPVYNSPLVTQLVNKILLDGKRSIAQSIVYSGVVGGHESTAEELEPMSSVLNARVAELLLSLGRTGEAETAARAAVQNGPDESRARFAALALRGLVCGHAIDPRACRR